MPVIEYRFAKKGEELACEILDAVNDFQDYAINNGHVINWVKNQDNIEGRYFETYPGDDIIDVGEQGEFKAMFFNHFRNFYTHIFNQVTSSPPAYTCTSTNSDSKSKKETQVAKRIVDHYLKVRRFEDDINDTVKKGICYGDGYLFVEWDPFGGDVIGKEGKKDVYEGDFETRVKTPWDVCFDYNKERKKDWQWVIVRNKVNRYDLAATFPKHKDAITSVDDYRVSDKYYDYTSSLSDDLEKDTDDIWLYSFYHKRTPTLPDGKYALVIGDDNNGESTLYENNTPYKKRLPIFNLSPDEFMTESFGYTDLNSCRGPQELMNIAISAIATNAIAAGSQSIYAGPSGSNLDVESTVDGMNFFYGDVKPEVIDFYRENPGLENLINICKQNMETFTGQNSVTRGDVAGSPNLKSGVAIATVINMAAQYSMGAVKSYYKLFEDVFTFLIDVLKVTATKERLLEIVGKRREGDVSAFKSDDIASISRVVVERVNPISKSYAGSIEVGMELLKIQQITPEQFFDLINTGNIDFATDNKERMMDLITAYKDGLLAGEVLPAVPGINHRLFMQEIQSLMFDKELLIDPNKSGILQNILDLLQQQMDFVRNGDEVAEYIYTGQIPQPPPPPTIAPPPQGAPAGMGNAAGELNKAEIVPQMPEPALPQAGPGVIQ